MAPEMATATYRFGGDDLARLADLPVVGGVSRVDGGAAGADGAAEQVGEVHDHLEVLAGLEAAAAGDDDVGVGQIGPVGLDLIEADELGAVGGLDVHVEGLELGGLVPLERVIRGGAHRDDAGRG